VGETSTQQLCWVPGFVASERISHGWVNGSEQESRAETRIRLPIFSSVNN